MKTLPVLIAVAALVLLPAPVASSQQPGVSVSIEQRFEAAAPPPQAEVLQAVLDFAPGAWTPVHTHGGPAYVTVLAGEMTLRMSGSDQKFKAGEGWIDNPDEPHAAGNEGSTPARLVATFVLPKGATPTTVVETGATGALPPGPTTVAQHRFDAPNLATPLDVVQRLTEVAPGATVPMHTHPGPNVATALQGSLNLQMEGMTHSFKAGDSWVEPANVVHGGTATGSETVRLVGTTFTPRGAPVSAAAQPPAAAPAAPAAPVPAAAPPAQPARPPAQVPSQLPRTGNPLTAGLAAALLGLGLLVGGVALRRPRG